MKTTTNHLEQLRVKDTRFPVCLGINGYFEFKRPPAFGNGMISLFVISSDGQNTGWEHVSVSVKYQNRLPSWEEMNFIKDQFWNDDEVVVQFHPKKQDYIDNAPVLHLWREINKDYQTPPTHLIGVKGAKIVQKLA
jgi:hypothetical protein